MTLEIGTFPVTDVVVGGRTRWADGVLEIDTRELLDLVLDDPAVAGADIEVARPGESARIIRIRDIIEPKCKVEGPGVTYPGIAGRPVAIVGRGKTHRLGGMTIMPCSAMPERNADGTRWWAQSDVTFVDMSGPGAVTPFAGTVNLCITMEPTEGAYAEDWNRVLQTAMLKVNDRVARTTLGLHAPQTRTYDLDRRDGSLPNVVRA